MDKVFTREDIFKVVENIEHPEIAKTLMELGMILDIAVEDKMVNVAMALPALGIPEIVRNMLVEIIRLPIEGLGFKMNVQFFEMTPEVRNNFLALAKANWKGSV